MVRSWVQVMCVLAVMAVVSLTAASAQAQRRQGGPGGPGGFGGFGGAGGEAMQQLMLLNNPAVREELAIVKEQEEQLTAIQEKLRDQARGQFQGLRDLSDEERRARFEGLRTTMEERSKEIQKELDDVLLPQQRTRLAQISLQQRLRFGGGTSGLTNPVVIEKLGITEEQKEKIESMEQDVEKELQEKIAKARQEAREKLLGALTPEQQKQFKELIGTEFRMPQGQGIGGFNRGGDAQRGGDQPGGRGGRFGGRRGGGENN